MIDAIKIKIIGWDGESLEVEARDALNSNADPVCLAFQPAYFNDVENQKDLIKRIAQACVQPIEQLEVQTEIQQNAEISAEYFDLVNQEFEFSLSDLYRMSIHDVDSWKERNDIINSYPIASVESIEQILLNDYKNIVIGPYIRQSDKNVIGIYVNAIGGNEMQAILYARRMYKDAMEMGIPIISDIKYDDADFQKQLKFIEFVKNNDEFSFLNVIERDGIHFLYSTWNLEYAKNAKRVQINRDRVKSAELNIALKDTKFQSTGESRENLRDLLVGLEAGYTLPTGFTWRDVENNDVRMTKTDLKKLFSLMTKQKIEAYSDSFLRKELLEQATTIEEVKEV